MSDRTQKALTALATVLLAVAIVDGALAADELERCYGIARKGENDGLASDPSKASPATSKIDYDGTAWKFVRKGTCTSIESPFGKGSLTPLPGRPPQRKSQQPVRGLIVTRA